MLSAIDFRDRRLPVGEKAACSTGESAMKAVVFHKIGDIRL
jgi:hypothetical protein